MEGQEATAAQVPRVRANAKQSTKGEWALDVTVECFNGESAASLLASKIGEVESALRSAGHKLASDAA